MRETAICEHLFGLFEECLRERPFLWMEFSYTRPTDWRAVVWDRTGGAEQTLVDVQNPERHLAAHDAAVALQRSRTLGWHPASQWDAVHEKLAGALTIKAWPPRPEGCMSTGLLAAGVRIEHTSSGLEVVSAEHRNQYQNRDAALREMIRLLRERGLL